MGGWVTAMCMTVKMMTRGKRGIGACRCDRPQQDPFGKGNPLIHLPPSPPSSLSSRSGSVVDATPTLPTLDSLPET